MNARAPIFSEREQTMLIELVQKHYKVLGNKRTDAFMWKEKERGWNILTEEYNALADNPRTPTQLRSKFISLKKRTRQLYRTYKAHCKGTSGGAPMPKMGLKHARILSLMNVSAKGLTSRFDSDANTSAVESSSQRPCLPDATVSCENYTAINPNGTDSTSPERQCLPDGSISWERYSLGMLRQPGNRTLRISESNSTSMEDLHEDVSPAGNVAEATANHVHNVKKFKRKKAETLNFGDWVQQKTRVLGTRSKIEEVNLEIAQLEKCCVQQKLENLKLVGDILRLKKRKLLSQFK